MHGPGTAAVVAGDAEVEAVSAPAGSVRSAAGVPGAIGCQPHRAGRGCFPAPARPSAGTAPASAGASPATGRVTPAPGMTPSVVPAARSAQLPCTDDPELFFAESPEDVETAKALCVGCAARLTCLSGAIERREPWGVWGGELFLRGEIVPRKRPRGRPRKAEVAA